MRCWWPTSAGCRATGIHEAGAWKQRLQVFPTKRGSRPRAAALNCLTVVRAFYLDIAHWATEDPARWGPWVVPCPIRLEEVSHVKERQHRKSRMDQRTREQLPILPVLVATVDRARRESAERLQAAQQVVAGQEFTAAGQGLRRSVTTRHAGARIWADELATGRRRDLTLEEHRGFWTWATVEVLRATGLRIEELTELSHHSFVHYTLPSTGELIPLLHIAPSKTDAERLLVISPELADVLSAIVARIRDPGGCGPAGGRLRPARACLEPAPAAAVPAAPAGGAPADPPSRHPWPAEKRAG